MAVLAGSFLSPWPAASDVSKAPRMLGSENLARNSGSAGEAWGPKKSRFAGKYSRCLPQQGLQNFSTSLSPEDRGVAKCCGQKLRWVRAPLVRAHAQGLKLQSPTCHLACEESGETMERHVFAKHSASAFWEEREAQNDEKEILQIYLKLMQQRHLHGSRTLEVQLIAVTELVKCEGLA